MKLFKTKYMWVITTIVLSIGYVVSCTKDNQVLDIPQINSSTDLISLKTTTPPTIDGTIDGIVPDGTFSTTWPYRPNYTSSPTQGEISNSQSLPLDGTGAKVNVPIWVIPGAGSAGYILIADTTSGKAKKVTGVSSTGVLTLSDGSTIDPTVGTDYQRAGTATGPTAKNSIPSYIGVPLIGGRADINAGAKYK